jgi:phosphoribosylformylglycinamidine cyclo-ligase
LREVAECYSGLAARVVLFPGGEMKRATYKGSGVDLGAYDRLVPAIKRILTVSSRSSGTGHFAGTVDLGKRSGLLLVASIDGVGTKVKVAKSYGRYSGLGRDIVSHCVNDILSVGARPVAFLDYIAFDRLDRAVLLQVLRGISGECRKNGIELVGGETAEMPGVYCRGEVDLAGCIVGLVERSRGLVDGRAIRKGDLVVGLPSNGLHTNGYSLARMVLLEKAGLRLDRKPPGWRQPLGEVLLEPHTNYFRDVYPLVETHSLTGIAHVTGGGIAGNLKRILPANVDAVLNGSMWKVPEVFRLIAEKGPVSKEEMFNVFNMGLGMLLVVPHANLPEVMKRAKGSRVVGEIVEGRGGVSIS